jgi:hypothetical protein
MLLSSSDARSYAYDEFKLKREITNIFNTAREMLNAAEHILQVQRTRSLLPALAPHLSLCV